jgi:hypothetical protein
MRESASDLLIQNCDEYYSYSDLAGLTRESDTTSAQRDPWELVRDAVATMSRAGDVMRSDRLKQVMQQLDPGFEERNAGFSRFSKFVLEASRRGLLRLSKLDNGQFEIGPAEPEAPKAPAATPSAPPAAEAKDDRRRRGRGRGRGRGGKEAPAAGTTTAPAPAAPARVEGLTLARSFDLMRLALGELPSPTGHEALRVRMAALHGREDPILQPDQFPRFLRQAHDAEAADVRKLGEGEFEVVARRTEATRAATARPAPRAPDATEAGAPEPAAETPQAAARRGGMRFRRGSRAGTAPPSIAMVGVVTLHDETPAAAPAEKPAPRRKKAAKASPTEKDSSKESAAAPTPRKKGGGRTRKKAAE